MLGRSSGYQDNLGDKSPGSPGSICREQEISQAGKNSHGNNVLLHNKNIFLFMIFFFENPRCIFISCVHKCFSDEN